MKKNLLVFTLVFLVAGTIILSCSKNGGSSSTGTCKMTQWVQGIGNNDTLKTLTYDNNGHLSRIIATYGGLYPDTSLFTFDANGRLSTTSQPYDTHTYTYNSNGLISTITATWGNQTYITYGLNNLPTLVKNYYNGSLSTIDSVQFDSNGDLISVKEVSGGTVTQVTFQYNTYKNSLAPQWLLNYNNFVGLNDMFIAGSNSFEFIVRYYSAHLLSKCTFSNGNNITFTYSYDASLNVTNSKAVVLTSSNGNYIFTRSYNYNCN